MFNFFLVACNVEELFVFDHMVSAMIANHMSSSEVKIVLYASSLGKNDI